MDKHIINRRIWLRAPLAALTLALVLLAVVAGGASAGDFSHDRKGLVLGFNLGMGSSTFEYESLVGDVERDIEDSFGGIGRIGYGISDHFMISFEGHGFGKEKGDIDVRGCMSLVTLTWFPGGGGFFARVGLGDGSADVKLPGPPTAVDWTEREAEGAGGLGIGYEWRLGRKFALGIALDGTAMVFEDKLGFKETVLGNGIASIQMNWYL